MITSNTHANAQSAVNIETLLQQPRAAIRVTPNSDQEVLRLRAGARLFSNREYRLREVPTWLYDETYLRASIDSSRFEVLENGLLLAFTPQPVAGADARASELEAQGFRPIEDSTFQLFNDKPSDKVLVFAKQVQAGETYEYGKYVLLAGFARVDGALDQQQALRDKSWFLYPENIPNTGYLLVDQEKDNSSGHGGITLTEAQNGDILAFYSVTSPKSWRGHSVSGWSRYKRSTDGGLSWGEPVDFEPSKALWEGDEVHAGLVFSVITAPDGTLVATLMRYANPRWEKQLAPLYYLSHDHGKSWEGPHSFDPEATVDTLAMTLSTDFVRDGEVFIVFRGGGSNMEPGGRQTLWVSKDNGQSFQERSVLPFDDVDYYWAAGTLDDGSIIVYTYNAHALKEEERPQAEKNIRYTISRDGGYSWAPIETTYFAKGIRNMQMSGKLGDYYYMQGRSGSYDRTLEGDDPGPEGFVLYASKDGIYWDEGVTLVSRQQIPGGGDHYSSNAIVGKYDSEHPERLMVLADVSYNGPSTDMHYWWVSKDALPKFSLKQNATQVKKRMSIAVDLQNGFEDEQKGLGASLAEEKASD